MANPLSLDGMHGVGGGRAICLMDFIDLKIKMLWGLDTESPCFSTGKSQSQGLCVNSEIKWSSIPGTVS